MFNKNTAKILIIILLLSGCSVNNCKVGYEVSVEEKQQTTDSDEPKQKIIDLAKDLKDNVKPGAQVSCSY